MKAYKKNNNNMVFAYRAFPCGFEAEIIKLYFPYYNTILNISYRSCSATDLIWFSEVLDTVLKTI